MIKAKTFKAAIFDMDGLMFDTEKLFLASQMIVAKRHAWNFTEAVHKKMMGKKPPDAIRVLLEEVGSNADPAAILEERNREYVHLIKTGAQPMRGLFELIKMIDAHSIRKAIATSSNREWMDILLSNAGLIDAFEVIATGEDVQKGKPDPEIYSLAVSRLGLLPKQCVALEDSVPGVRSAKAAGLSAVAVPSEYTRNEDFSEADLVVSTLADNALIQYLGL